MTTAVEALTNPAVLLVFLLPLWKASYFIGVRYVGQSFEAVSSLSETRYFRLQYSAFLAAMTALYATLFGFDVSLQFGVIESVAVAGGIFLFVNDQVLWEMYNSLRGRTVVDRDDGELLWLTPVLLTAVLEELLYRNGMSALLDVDGTIGVVLFVVLSSLSFGSNHFWYGWNEVFLKGISGAAYCLLFVTTGSVVAPAMAHIGYNLAYLISVSDVFASTDHPVLRPLR